MNEVAWQDSVGRRVRVRAPTGSWAAGRAPEVLREAERVAEALRELLRPTAEGDRVDLYLIDLVAGSAPPAP